MRYVIFDDDRFSNFFPITFSRSVGDLRVGVLKLRQRLAAHLEIDDYDLIISEKLTETYRERFPSIKINRLEGGEYIFVNSRLQLSPYLILKIKNLAPETGLFSDQTVIAFRTETSLADITTESIKPLYSNIRNVNHEAADLWNFLWEMITANPDQIRKDFEEHFYENENFFVTEQGVTALNPYNLWIGEGAEISPGVVIDASKGPVVIDEGCSIMPNAVIVGPVYIGKKTVIKSGARIYPGTSIGPVYKIGGEVENTIFQAYSNKQHDGFLGHSYIGEWVNIGADTNNSDLKNNYRAIMMYSYPIKSRQSTSCQFLGTVVGDHTKIGINCSINTGTVIGVGCNLYGSDLISDHIPSFSWGTAKELTTYRFESFCETASIVKKRRQLTLSDHEINLFNDISLKAND